MKLPLVGFPHIPHLMGYCTDVPPNLSIIHWKSDNLFMINLLLFWFTVQWLFDFAAVLTPPDAAIKCVTLSDYSLFYTYKIYFCC